MSPADTSQSDRSRWLAFSFVALAQLMVFIDAAVMNIALPSAQHALHISDAGRQWVITAYGLAFGGLLILGGRAGDRFGRKRVFIIGLVGFAAASALGGSASNEAMLLSARALQGAFGALLVPTSLALISLAFTEPRERAKAFGVYGAVATAGGAIGLVLGGALTEYFNWRFSMFVNLPIAAVGLAGALAFVHDIDGQRSSEHIDLPSAILATVGLVALVYGFAEAENHGWGAAQTFAPIIGGIVMLAVFIALQARTAMPLLPLRVLTERNRAGSYLSLALSVISMFGMFLLLSYYFQLVRGYSPIDAGLAFLPMAIAQATGATQIGARLTPHLQPRIIMSGGYLLTAVGVMMLALLEPDSSLLFVFAAEIVVGLGIGAAFMPATSIGTHGVEPRDMGVASAMIGTSQQIGGSIGTALLNTIAASSAAAYLGTHISAGRAQALVHGYSIAYWWGVGFLIVAAAISALAVNARRPSMTAAEPTDDAETPRTEDSAVPVSHSAQA